MITNEDYFYAFFAAVISFFIGFLLVFLVYPNYFQHDPSSLVIALVIFIEVTIFSVLFFIMRKKR
jgi:ABC-type antimicrobial peptide transport system permease subunit